MGFDISSFESDVESDLASDFDVSDDQDFQKNPRDGVHGVGLVNLSSAPNGTA